MRQRKANHRQYSIGFNSLSSQKEILELPAKYISGQIAILIYVWKLKTKINLKFNILKIKYKLSDCKQNKLFNTIEVQSD